MENEPVPAARFSPKGPSVPPECLNWQLLAHCWALPASVSFQDNGAAPCWARSSLWPFRYSAMSAAGVPPEPPLPDVGAGAGCFVVLLGLGEGLGLGVGDGVGLGDEVGLGEGVDEGFGVEGGLDVEVDVGLGDGFEVDEGRVVRVDGVDNTELVNDDG